ncbi:MAG: hypothetical protein ACLTDT_08375 [Clostridium sp.]
MDETNLKIINMSDVESKEISWLWYPFIPYGKLTIIQGDPGEGKNYTRIEHCGSSFQRTGAGRTYETGTATAYYLPDGRRWLG